MFGNIKLINERMKKYLEDREIEFDCKGMRKPSVEVWAFYHDFDVIWGFLEKTTEEKNFNVHRHLLCSFNDLTTQLVHILIVKIPIR